MTTVKIDFSVIINESTDKTYYEIHVDGSPFAIINDCADIV